MIHCRGDGVFIGADICLQYPRQSKIKLEDIFEKTVSMYLFVLMLMLIP